MPDRGAVPVSGTALGPPRGGPPLACEALQGLGGIRHVFRCHGRQRPHNGAPSGRPMAGDGPNWKRGWQRFGPGTPATWSDPWGRPARDRNPPRRGGVAAPRLAGKLVHGGLGPSPAQGRTLGGTVTWPKELRQGHC
jgi:hypothetical protein